MCICYLSLCRTGSNTHTVHCQKKKNQMIHLGACLGKDGATYSITFLITVLQMKMLSRLTGGVAKCSQPTIVAAH